MLDGGNRKTSVENVPEYTLRKTYTKRPSHVIRLQLSKPSSELNLPEDDTRRMWVLTNDTNVVIKTWHFEPLPSVSHIFKDKKFESVSLEFNVGPHEKDLETLQEIAAFNSESFSLEFREHWAGLYPTEGEFEEDMQLRQQKPHSIGKQQEKKEPSTSYSDKFLKPFIENETTRGKVRVLTGKMSFHLLKELPLMVNLKFLGLRVNYEEYQCFAECIQNFHSLERIHLLPQWKFNDQLIVPPIRFLGVLTIYYWDLETTQSVKKSHKRWKKKQSKKSFFCW